MNGLNINVASEWNFWFEYPSNLKAQPHKRPKVNPSYYFIFNCITNKILYTSDSFSEILGYTMEDYSFLEMIGFLHPDDNSYVKECERQIIDFISSLSENEQFRFIITYTFRTKTAEGKYIRVRQNYQALEISKNGKMSRALVHHEVLEEEDHKKSDDFQIFDRQSNKAISIKNNFKLTKREAEIFQLIKDGFTSLEISNKLFLSKFTIDTHRKNILAKTNCRKFITMVG